MTFTVASIEGRLDNRLAVNAIHRTQGCLPYYSTSLLLSPRPPQEPVDRWIEIPDYGPPSHVSVRGINNVCLRQLTETAMPEMNRCNFAAWV